MKVFAEIKSCKSGINQKGPTHHLDSLQYSPPQGSVHCELLIVGPVSNFNGVV